MFASLSPDYRQWMDWSWAEYKPFVDDLLARPLDARSLDAWMRDWSRLDETLTEMYNRMYVATTVNTADSQAEQAYTRFLDDIYPNFLEADQALKQKLLDSGLEPAGFAVPLRNLRAEADLFRPENLPLLAEEQKLKAEYDRIAGGLTLDWEGQELTVTQMRTFYQDADRSRREQAWRRAAERQLADRQAI
ncbi:MAG TPA: M3 family oligoendopeptidase, partial [Anaerolineaceae bacterium]|nr:M3 family oligoendopeptidase [Anaerolineaceae bacterium]